MANFRPQAIAPVELDLDQIVLGALARGGISVPPYPAVALRIQEVVNRKSFGLADVTRIVSADAALTADVLRCANSAMFGRGAHATTLAQAITRIGAREVMRLALSSGLAAHAQAAGSLAPLKRFAWIESVSAAGLCQELARHRGLDAEEAFIVGLLHDFGKVVATAFLERLLAQHPRVGSRPLDYWATLLERHHVAAGMAIAVEWNLPPLVAEVIALHHEGGGSPEARPLVDVVRTCDAVVALLAAQPQVALEDLAGVPSLAAAEREVVARTIGAIPELVAAFEAPAAPAAAPAPSLVEAPLTALAPGQRAVTFAVTASVAKRVRNYVAAAIATNGLVVLGEEALPEHQLLEITLHAPPKPFRIWATAKVCRQEGAGVRVGHHGGEPARGVAAVLPRIQSRGEGDCRRAVSRGGAAAARPRDGSRSERSRRESDRAGGGLSRQTADRPCAGSGLRATSDARRRHRSARRGRPAHRRIAPPPRHRLARICRQARCRARRPFALPPGGSTEEILEVALDLLLAAQEKKKGIVANPRPPRIGPAKDALDRFTQASGDGAAAPS